jgi:protein-L-isoaspartate O-methyltransferase
MMSILVLAPGCRKAAPPPEETLPAEDNLIVILPESVPPPEHSPERVTKLTINGKDEPIKVGSDRKMQLKVAPIKGKETITAVYDYWPSSYSNTIRTKVIKLEKGKKVEVDFNKEDPDHPDRIKPIYFPTPPQVVDEMCKMASVGKGDVVYDIGCGDGRLVITSVKKFGAKKGVGVDINAELIKVCNENAAKDGVADKVEFRNEDALTIKDLSDATVVLLYVGEDFGKKLEPVLRKTLKPGARVVSHRFPLGDWAPTKEQTIKAKNNSNEERDYVLKLWKIEQPPQ